MNQAHQRALYQQTNQGLLDIRQLEIDYHINLNIAFGTQAALIGGFTYGVFTQNQLNYDNYYVETVSDAYWITSAMTIAFSVHVIITTMLIQVLGPGLALHGPLGSMARATEGLRVEQKPIIYSFVWMMVMFAVSTTLSFWVVMSVEAAIGSSICFLIASRYWYFYCERIYIRFHWEPEEKGWNERTESDDYYDIDSINNQQGNLTNNQNTSELNTNNLKPKKKIKMIKFPFLSSKKTIQEKKKRLNSTEKSEISDFTDHSSANNTVNNNIEVDVNVEGQSLSMEGYITKRNSSKLLDYSKDNWDRCYCTLNVRGDLFFFKNRQGFRTNPRSPINRRPLSLQDYIIFVRIETDIRASVGGGQNLTNIFEIILLPQENSELIEIQHQLITKQKAVIEVKEVKLSRNKWVLRLDTEEELNCWVDSMKKLVPGNFPYE